MKGERTVSFEDISQGFDKFYDDDSNIYIFFSSINWS